MGEEKRKGQAPLTVTAEHRRMAARIDARIQQLDALRLAEAEIISGMAGYMPDFHHLMTSTSSESMDALCHEFSGFYRFAKILERLAADIASGKIKVPGTRTISNEHQIAAAIDQRMCQLEATGIGGAALLERMVGHVLDLERLWSTTSDELLITLCRTYPGLYRYGMLVENAVKAENDKPTTCARHGPEASASLKATVAQLLTDGAALESGFQTLLDANEQHDRSLETKALKGLHRQWAAQLAGVYDEFRSANAPDYAILLRIFDPMAQRIDHLDGQVL